MKKKSYAHVLKTIYDNISIYILGGSKKHLANAPKWTTFQHNGPYFSPDYMPHQVPVMLRNQAIFLTPVIEEYLTFYVRYLDTEYIKIPAFKTNFWHDFKILLKNRPEEKYIRTLEDFGQLDFSRIKAYLATKEKQPVSGDIGEYYGFAIVDGVKQPVGNYRVEPPGIFIGRGKHPQIGKIKPRLYPENFTLNLSADATVPPAPTMEGSPRSWKSIVHNRQVEWLASWVDPISKKTKYIWLSNSSHWKAKSDKTKFSLAETLEAHIKKLRKKNLDNLNSKDAKIRQLSTALYLIDNLSIRVGNEKSADELDTVGATSLRCKHIKMLSNDPPTIELDFLGKDSVRYFNQVKVNADIYRNLLEMSQGKGPNDPLFDRISGHDINKYLQNFMPRLTAKVFRTYNSSRIFKEQLSKIKTEGKSEKEILKEYNQANITVARLCNHQKSVPKNHEKTVKKIKEQIKEEKQKLRGDDQKKTSRQKLERLELKKKDLIENINLSITTSKTNYIDPRIGIEFLIQNKIPLEKVFSKTLLKKFKWAVDEVKQKS
ncbi:DNA topoisomerase type 1B [Namao virus]|nr:DNA topoisomerase type 1B [Namao virus]